MAGGPQVGDTCCRQGGQRLCHGWAPQTREQNRPGAHNTVYWDLPPTANREDALQHAENKSH